MTTSASIYAFILFMSISAVTGVSNGTANENHVNDGTTYVFGSLNDTFNYELREYLDEAESESWPLGPYVLLAKNFILAVLHLDLDWLRGLILGEEQMDIQAILDMGLPVMILIGLGFLFSIFTPIVGLFFFCCRCCGNCGGKLTVEKARQQNNACGCVNFLLLLVSAAMLMVGAGAIFTVGGRLSHVAEHVINVADNAIDDVVTFKDQLFSDLMQIGVDDVNFVSNHLADEFETMPEQVTEPFFEASSVPFNALIDSLTDIDAYNGDLDASMTGVLAAMATVTAQHTVMSASLTAAHSTLTDLHTDCGGSSAPASVCSDLPLTSALPALFDFTSGAIDASDMVVQQACHDAVAALGAQAIADSAEAVMHEDIPQLVANSTGELRELAVDVLDDVASIVEPLLESTSDSFDNATHELDELKESVRDFSEKLDPVLVLVAQVFMGVSGLVILVLLCDVAGVLLGLPNCRAQYPERRNATGHCGARLLMTSSCLSFLFVLVYLLVGTLLFLLGTAVTVICAPVRDLTIFSQILDSPDMWEGEYLLGAMLLENGSVPLTVSGILRECQNDTAAYTALQIKQRVDIETMVNLEEKLPDLEPMKVSVRSAVSGVTLVDAATKTAISGLAGVHTAAATRSATAATKLSDMQAGLTAYDFALLITEFDDLAGDTDGHDAAFAARLRGMRDELSGIENAEKATMDGLVSDIDDALTSMETAASNVNTALPLAVDRADDFEAYLPGDGVDALVDAVADYIARILSFAHQLIVHVARRLAHDMAKCGLVWDMYDGATGIVCVYFLDAFNGLWLSLCLIGVFFITNIWFGVRLAKYFKKPDDYIDY